MNPSPSAIDFSHRTVSPARTLISHSPITASPLYLQAEKLCKEKRFQQAADALLQLSQTPELSSEDKAFCLKQQEICLAHLTSKPTRKPEIAVDTSRSARPARTSDCGPASLLLLCRKFGVKATLAELREAGGTNEKGTTLQGMARAAEKTGWKSEGVQVSREALSEIQTPAIAWTEGDHYLAVLEMQGRGERGTVLIQDPGKSEPETISQEKLLQRCGGYLLLLKR